MPSDGSLWILTKVRDINLELLDNPTERLTNDCMHDLVKQLIYWLGCNLGLLAV